MNNSTKITIYDNEGNCLLNDNVSSPFVGLQAGEAFWFGTDSNRTWAKVIKITYGLDTNTKCFVIEIIVEKTEKGITKLANPEANFIDHGEKEIPGEYGGTWSINNSDIILTTGVPRYGYVRRITLQVNSAIGPVTKTIQDLHCGEILEVKTKDRIVIGTLISASIGMSYYSIVRVTESKFLK